MNLEELKEKLAEQQKIVVEAEKGMAPLVKQKYVAHQAMLKIRSEAAELIYGVKLGSIIRPLRGGSAEARGKVSHVRVADSGPIDSKPWIRIHVRLDDGSWSDLERDMYDDWEVVNEV